MSFSEFNLPEWLIRTLTQLSITEPTSIQSQGLPITMNKQDLLANAMTGSGKTLLYLLPIMNSLFKDPVGVNSLIISPSRELAKSLEQQFSLFASKINCRVAVITGGKPLLDQFKLMEEIPHVIICTPGRFWEILVSGHQSLRFLKNIKTLVLDEFDRLVDPTLLYFVQNIIKFMFRIPDIPCKDNIYLKPGQKQPFNKIQKILTTATFDQKNLSLENLKDKFYMKDLDIPVLNLNKQLQVVQSIKQYYLFFPLMYKDFYFVNLIFRQLDIDFDTFKKDEEYESNAKIVIFFNQCKKCHYWYKLLKSVGLRVSVVHSFLKQHKRTSNLLNFISGQNKILLATDLASRGLDLKMVTSVINYDLPREAKGITN